MKESKPIIKSDGNQNLDDSERSRVFSVGSNQVMQDVDLNKQEVFSKEIPLRDFLQMGPLDKY
jgi:hypothetical protein